MAGLSRAAEIHLEHSFIPEGSSWGTDDGFRRALSLPDGQIPELFRIPAVGSMPEIVDVSDLPLAAGRFVGNRISLFRSIRFCVDESLPALDSRFSEALETFSEQVAGKKENGRLFEISPRRVRSGREDFTGCSILAIRGAWNKFPYRFLPDGPSPGKGAYIGKVFALFYRWDEVSVPVIIVHPEIELSLSPPDGRYVTESPDRLIVDARVLLLHEIGHILGFAHIKPSDGAFDFPEATAMGVDSDFRDSRRLSLRFEFATQLWKYWDAYQTTIYRRVFQREMNPTCKAPDRDLEVLPGNRLEAAVDEFNARWGLSVARGRREVTVAAVRHAVFRAIKDIPGEFCPEFQSVLQGQFPESAEFRAHFEAEKWGGGVVTLEVARGSLGYSVPIELDGFEWRAK